MARRGAGSGTGSVAAALVVLAGCGAGQGAPAPRQPPCPAGVAEVRAAADVEALRSCSRLAGLVVRSGAPLSLALLSQLQQIDGDLIVGPTLGVDSLELSALRRVGGVVRIAGNSSLAGVFLPRLEAAERVELEHNAALTGASLPALRTAQQLVVRHNAELEALTLSALAGLGELLLSDSPQLGVLLTSPQLRVDRWPSSPLPSMDAAELEALRARASASPAP
jgi:hypothetical protein